MRLKIFFALLIGGLLLASCNDDKLSGQSVFDTTTPPKTAFDNWLDDNFGDPYNIKVEYRLDDMEAPFTQDVVPADLEISKRFAVLVKHIWLDGYAEVAKDKSAFLKQYAPRVLTFIGDGNAASATAEGGLKIVFYWLNNINYNDMESLSVSYFQTIHHEFQHILNQKVVFPPEYDVISDGFYTDTSTQQQALDNGFVSAYSRRNVREDKAEIYSWYVTLSAEQWAARIASASDAGEAKIVQKVNLMKAYMLNNFGIDMDEMRAVNQRRMSEIPLLDLDNLPF